ncbi:MAG: hypothetical protein ABL931_22155 [Usitatibacteraceae bacterium]
MSATPRQWLQQHGLTALIGLLVVGLLLVIGYETQWGTSLRPTPVVAAAQAAKAGDTSLTPAFALPPVDPAFKETLERPLFLPTRRPVPVVTGAVQPMMKKGQFRLAGTVVNQDLPYAFLVEIATGKGMRVAKGAEIVSSGISVASIDAVRVVLKQGDETEELSLRTASSPPPSAAPAAMPGSAVPGVPQRPPPSGVVVGNIPNAPGAPLPGASATTPQPNSSALPGFVQAPPGTTPNAVPANPTDATVGLQRRRRFPNVPQQ